MKLYYLTAACSLASNISLREAGLKFELVKVDRHTKMTSDGLDYREINPKGYVPALRLDNGEILTENDAILQYIADRNPAAKLRPGGGHVGALPPDRMAGLHQLRDAQELHAAVPGRGSRGRQGVRLGKVLRGRLDYLRGASGTRTFLMGEQFTVADAYLYIVLSWGRS